MEYIILGAIVFGATFLLKTVLEDWKHGYPSHVDDPEEIKVTREVMSFFLYPTDDSEGRPR